MRSGVADLQLRSTDLLLPQRLQVKQSTIQDDQHEALNEPVAGLHCGLLARRPVGSCRSVAL